ncbi:TraM recognition domain-containing protein [Pseudomonas aeruginosa]|nr:TraM recognition domain-containing protein [Pseudomonas aeruginosa]
MEFLRLILVNTNPGIAAVMSLLLGVLLVLSITGAVRETKETTALELFLIWLRRAMVILLAMLLPLTAAALYLLAYVSFGQDWTAATNYMNLWVAELKAAASDMWWSLIVVFLMPVLVRTIVLRWLRPALSSWTRKFRVRQTGDALSDIRIEVSRIKAKDFNPRDYYQDGVMFLGLDGAGQPIYMDDEVFKKNHLKIIGPSQTGKGVGLGVLLDQAIKKGWGAWFIDLKPDDFLYDIMRESCELNGRPTPRVLDFNGVGDGYYAPFVNGTMRERRERVVKAFTMADTGQTADFYKRIEREILDFLMPLWDGTLNDLKKLLDGKHPEISDAKRSWIRENCGAIKSNASEFSQLESLCATKEQSFDVASALHSSEVVYVRSHMKDTIVRKGTVALLDEVIQVALRRPLPKHVLLIVDECRFVVSDTLADALATVLSKGISMGLAYQSVKDLLNLPDKSLNAESIKTATETNTQITVSYRANDDETAEWVSLQTGTVQKSVTKLEKVETNRGGAEEWSPERSVGQVEEALIPANQLLSLPPRVGALIRPNTLATLLYTCWIPIKDRRGIPNRGSALAAIKPIETATPASATEGASADPFGDPFAASASDELNAPGADPFAALDNAEADPFASLETGSALAEAAGDDPFNAPDSDPFSEANGESSKEQSKTSKPAKGKLSADEEAAITAALAGILTEEKPRQQQKSTPEQPKRESRVDLSELDDLEGI